MQKEKIDLENDSYRESSDFSSNSSDSEESEKEDKKEMPHYWKEKNKISDSIFLMIVTLNLKKMMILKMKIFLLL